MPKAKVNGVEIYYETHGEGPAVVFAHGRAGSHLSWWRQVPAFRDRYRCITFDARGWGASTSQPGVNRRAAFGEDLKQLLDFLEEPEVYLVSQSMGGLTCMDFALAHPQRCLGLVLGDTTGGVGDPRGAGRAQGCVSAAGWPGQNDVSRVYRQQPGTGFSALPDRRAQLNGPPGRHRCCIPGPRRTKGGRPCRLEHANAADRRGRKKLSSRPR